MEEKNLFTRGPINQQTTQETGVTQNQYPGTQVGQSYGGVEAIDIDRALRVIAEKFVFPNEGLDFNHVVDQFENILILHALERTGWNRNRAAGLLRLNRTTLVEKLKKKQLVPPMRVADKFPPSGNA